MFTAARSTMADTWSCPGLLNAGGGTRPRNATQPQKGRHNTGNTRNTAEKRKQTRRHVAHDSLDVKCAEWAESRFGGGVVRECSGARGLLFGE